MQLPGVQAGAPAASAARAGSRAAQVFMGVDCFGRNTYGGGGYLSGEALRVAHTAGGLTPCLVHCGSHATHSSRAPSRTSCQGVVLIQGQPLARGLNGWPLPAVAAVVLSAVCGTSTCAEGPPGHHALRLRPVTGASAAWVTAVGQGCLVGECAGMPVQRGACRQPRKECCDGPDAHQACACDGLPSKVRRQGECVGDPAAAFGKLPQLRSAC